MAGRPGLPHCVPPSLPGLGSAEGYTHNPEPGSLGCLGNLLKKLKKENHLSNKHVWEKVLFKTGSWGGRKAGR